MTEFELIQSFFSKKAKNPWVQVGIGDDACLFSLPTGQSCVACMDTIAEGTHFFPHTVANAIGHKALAVNLSDLAAMGAKPSHFMLSIFLIGGAISLRYEMVGINSQPATGITKLLLPILVWDTLLVLIAGTVVTGSGPHAGDDQAERFNFDARVVSWIHADLVIALLVLTALLFLITRHSGLHLLHKRVGLFLAISLLQGVIGYVQYFTGLPVVLVALHLLGATLVWVSAWSLIKVADSGFRLRGMN
jgi:hypothetical protein